jgi:hypothetical protein
MGYIHFRFIFTLSFQNIELLDCEFRFKILAWGCPDRHYQYIISNLDVNLLPEDDAPPRPWRWPLRGHLQPWYSQWPHVNEGVGSPVPSDLQNYLYQEPEID